MFFSRVYKWYRIGDRGLLVGFGFGSYFDFGFFGYEMGRIKFSFRVVV